MIIQCVTLSLLMMVCVTGLPIHSGRFMHIIHHHENDQQPTHGHSINHNPVSDQKGQAVRKTSENNAVYDVPRNRHFYDSNGIFIEQLSKHLQKSKESNKNHNTRNQFTVRTSTERRNNNKVRSSKLKKHDGINRHKLSNQPIMRHGVKQKVITLPSKLHDSLFVDSVDHGFGIKKRGITGMDLIPSKNHLTPHLPQRYIENILKLNIWNSKNTIKVKPSSTELGSKWKPASSKASVDPSQQVVAKEFSSFSTKKSAIESSKMRETQQTTVRPTSELAPSSDLLQIYIATPETTTQIKYESTTEQTLGVSSSIKSNFQNKDHHSNVGANNKGNTSSYEANLHNKSNNSNYEANLQNKGDNLSIEASFHRKIENQSIEINSRKNSDHSSIEATLQTQHNVSKSDFIKLKGIHIMVSGLQQNLTSDLPTLHITASLSNGTQQSSVSTYQYGNRTGANNASSQSNTLVGTAVMKNGHLYLIVYPFDHTKTPSLKYKSKETVPLSNLESLLGVQPSTTTTSLPSTPANHGDGHHPIASLTSVEQEKNLPGVADKTHIGHMTSPHLMDNAHHGDHSSVHHAHDMQPLSTVVPKETTSQNVMDHSGHGSGHSTGHGHGSGHGSGHSTGHGSGSGHGSSHNSGHDLATAISHHAHGMDHAGSSHGGHSGHTSHGQADAIVDRFVSPWKQINLSSVLPYIHHPNKDNSSRDDDDSPLKLVPFVAEAKDPFVSIQRILGSLKNATYSATNAASVNDPTPDASFNFELHLQGTDVSSKSDVLSNDNVTRDSSLDSHGSSTTEAMHMHHHNDHVTNMPNLPDSFNDAVTQGFRDSIAESYKNTIGFDSSQGTTDAVTHPTIQPTQPDRIDPSTMIPELLGDRKETELYETIDSVIMQKLKAGHLTDPLPTRQVNAAPNVTLETLGIAKEHLTRQGSFAEYKTNVATKVDTSVTEPSTTSMRKTTSATIGTTPPASSKQQRTAMGHTNHQTIGTNLAKSESHSLHGSSTQYDLKHSSVSPGIVHGKPEPLISLTDVLNNIRKIQLQNSVRLKIRNKDFNRKVFNEVDKVSKGKKPVILEGPLFGDFIANTYKQSMINTQRAVETQPTGSNYKNWNQQAVRHALDAMLVLSVDDILADHTMLHGTIVMANNKDQSKDSSSNNSNN